MHPHGSVHELHPIGFTSLRNPIKLRHVQRHGLLQEDVLLLLRRQDRPRDAEAGGERDVDGVDVGVVEDGVVAAVDPDGGGEAVGGGEFGGLVEGAAADGVEGGVRGEGYGS